MREITEAFEKGDFTELVRLVDKRYGSGRYTLGLLFRDERRKIVTQILDRALKEAEMAYRQLYENRAPLMHLLAELKLPAIRMFQVAAEITLNSDLRRAIEAEHKTAKVDADPEQWLEAFRSVGEKLSFRVE